MITIEKYLVAAREQHATDLHLIVGMSPKCRINGILVDLETDKILQEDTDAFVKLILPRIYKSVLQKTGEVDFSYARSENDRYRVHIFRQRGFYSIIIHLIAQVIPEFSTLGLPKEILSHLENKRGLILVSGPSGSGKTTTITSFINQINQNQKKHIITIENPIEYVHQHKLSIINQREVNIDTRSYSKALYAALHEDADVIIVNNLNDADTIDSILTAVETGHLVIAIISQIGVVNTIQYMIHKFLPYQQVEIQERLANAIEAVLSQQLLLGIDEKKIEVAYEYLFNTPEVFNSIREGKIHALLSVMQMNKASGMQLMDDSIYELYLERRIEKEVALQYAIDKHTLKKKME